MLKMKNKMKKEVGASEVGKRKINLILIFSVIVILISVIVLIFSITNYLNKPIEKREFEVKFAVESGRAGFDINGSALTFGIIPPGGGGTRKIDIENNHDFPVKVKFFVSENLAGYMEFPEEMILERGQKETISVNINMPRDAEQTNYTGIFRIEFYKN